MDEDTTTKVGSIDNDVGSSDREVASMSAMKLEDVSI